MTEKLDIFLSPSLEGARFKEHGLPLDMMKDFYVFDEMLKSVAKTIYRNENPARQRLPRNFMNDISLQITSLDEGCTIVNICLICLTAAELFPSLAQDYAVKARDCIVQTIEAAERGTLDCNAPGSMTRAQLAMFDRFGCSLQEDESIEFPVAGTGRKAVLNREVRRKLAALASQDEFKESVSVYGAVSELDQDRTSFTLNTVDGQRLPVRSYGADHAEDVVKAMANYRNGLKVLLSGVGVYSSSGRLTALESTEDITLLGTVDFGYRLAEIAELKAGWLDGRGAAFDRSHLKRLFLLFRSNYTLDDDPYLFPLEDNLLQAEWDVGDWRMSMEIDLSTLSGDFYALNLSTNAEISSNYRLDNPAQWQSLCKVVEHPETAVQG